MTSFASALKWFGVFMSAALPVIAGCRTNVPQPSPPPSRAQASAQPAAAASSADASAAPVCITGQDQTCNDNPEMNSLHGKCTAAGMCECTAPFTKLSSGRCN